jgi:retron-type reverse transcriptase
MSLLVDKLSSDILASTNDLIYLIRSAPYRYKVYEIAKKKKGKKRTIAQPARELKRLQYWVMENVLRVFPVHPAATAYRKGRNIADNARPHASHAYLYKLDFRNFFPSIKATDFSRFMSMHPLATEWTQEDIDYLSRILFWRKKRGGELLLSIGAPSSPILSNILLYDFDVEVAALCTERGVTYTRYADDLTFSTDEPHVLREIEKQILKICSKTESPKLRVNKDKTVHASKKGARRVTGLVLTNDGLVSIGREKKREIRASFHRYVLGTLNIEEICALAGMVAYIKSVEPKFLEILARRYGAAALSTLLSGQVGG